MTVQPCSFRLNSPPDSTLRPAQSELVIGGWFPQRGTNGEIDTRSSWWFSVEIKREEWPWVFEKSSKPSLAISSLEAMAVLMALMLCNGDEERG